MKRETPAGTWPLLLGIALVLLITPAVLLGLVVPAWLAAVGAWLFLALAVLALAWSWIVFLRTRGTPAVGVPIAGLVFGVLSVCLAVGVVLLPRL
jgi:hypothetical protein